eukprot:1144490-Pelagomonas_calceolata.AAC.4
MDARLHAWLCPLHRLLLPFVAYSLALGNQQQATHQRLPHPHTQVRGAGHAPHCISKLHVFNSSSTEQLTPALFLKINQISCRNWNYANPLAQQQAGMVCRWTAKSPEWAPPDPGPSKGNHESMLMELVSTDAVCSGGLRLPGRENQHQKL